MNIFKRIINSFKEDVSETAILGTTEAPIGVVAKDRRRKLPADIGTRGAVDEKHKRELAFKLAKGYVEWGDPFVIQILERMVDVRMCSLIGYNLAVALFESGGASVAEQHPEILQLMNLDLTLTAGRTVIDHSFVTSFLMPVKYRGYGHPVNSRDNLGHLFQVNLCSFPVDSMYIGYKDNHDGDLNVMKGLVSEGYNNGWRIYRLDPDTTDDMTAVFTVDSLLPDRLIEICHYTGVLSESPFIYRFAKNKTV